MTMNYYVGMINEETVTYRPGFARGLSYAVLAIAVIGLVSSLIGDFAATWRYIPVVALVVTAVWAAYYWPAVTVSPFGVTIRNVTRTIELPWPSIQSIETKFALTLHTAYGNYSAWAAPAPGRAEVARMGNSKIYRSEAAGIPQSQIVGGAVRAGDLPGSNSGRAAMLVRSRWEELQQAGFLDNARLESAKPKVTWHWQLGLLLLGLALASILALHFGTPAYPSELIPTVVNL